MPLVARLTYLPDVEMPMLEEPRADPTRTVSFASWAICPVCETAQGTTSGEAYERFRSVVVPCCLPAPGGQPGTRRHRSNGTRSGGHRGELDHQGEDLVLGVPELNRPVGVEIRRGTAERRSKREVRIDIAGNRVKLSLPLCRDFQ